MPETECLPALTLCHADVDEMHRRYANDDAKKLEADVAHVAPPHSDRR